MPSRPRYSRTACCTLAHARRKFFDLHAVNKSQIAGFALEQLGKVYDIEREVKDLHAEQRKAIRQQRTKPRLDALHQRMSLQRHKLPDSSTAFSDVECVARACRPRQRQLLYCDRADFAKPHSAAISVRESTPRIAMARKPSSVLETTQAANLRAFPPASCCPFATTQPPCFCRDGVCAVGRSAS